MLLPTIDYFPKHTFHQKIYVGASHRLKDSYSLPWQGSGFLKTLLLAIPMIISISDLWR